MRWVEKEVDYLKENYSKNIPLSEISKKLNRSIKSIHRKSQEIKLSRPWRRFNKPLSKQPKSIIDRRYYEKNKDEIYKRKIERLRNTKKEFVDLLGGKCYRCGYNKCLAALEFHHKKGKKEGAMKEFIKNFSKEKALKEIKKCILVCANCHRELHHKGL